MRSPENEFRNIKLKLKGLQRNAEIQAVKALIAMSVQQNLSSNQSSQNNCVHTKVNNDTNDNTTREKHGRGVEANREGSISPDTAIRNSITITEEEFRIMAEKAGIINVIGDPVCKLCGSLFEGPLGIALHSCPAYKHQVFRCHICGEDKWKTKANLHSHIKWCNKKLVKKLEATKQK